MSSFDYAVVINCHFHLETQWSFLSPKYCWVAPHQCRRNYAEHENSSGGCSFQRPTQMWKYGPRTADTSPSANGKLPFLFFESCQLLSLASEPSIHFDMMLASLSQSFNAKQVSFSEFSVTHTTTILCSSMIPNTCSY